MSRTGKWVIGIIIVVVVVLGVWWWWGGMSTPTTQPTSQPAAAATSVTSTSSAQTAASAGADAAIAQNSQSLNTQIQALATLEASFNSKTPATSISQAVSLTNQAISALSQLTTQVQSRLTTTKGLTNLPALSASLKGASSQYLLASSATANASNLLKNPTASNLQQAVSQLGSALTTLKGAYASVNAVATAAKGH